MLARSFLGASATSFNYNKRLMQVEFKRNVQVTVVGAASEIGSNLSLLLKQNSKVKTLHLQDDGDSIKGIGMDLAHVIGGPNILTFAGERNLGASLRGSHIILMTSRAPRRPGRTREGMLSDNALRVKNLCRAMVDNNPSAFLAISTNPINSIVPFASGILCKYNCYNPCKLLGITHIDTARSRALVGTTIGVNPQEINVPVIGGHSDDTIIPLFSNMTPKCYALEQCQADTLTRLVRKAGTEVVTQKKGSEAATVSVAWAIHEFVDGLIDAVCGQEKILNCYTVNPHYATRFFSGPTTVGFNGITKTCQNLPLSDYEQYLLNGAVPLLIKDVTLGENFVQYITGLGKAGQ